MGRRTLPVAPPHAISRRQPLAAREIPLKALHLVLLASFALATLAAAAPTARAVDLVCVVGDGDPACRDQLACTKNVQPRACVRDPCATTHCLGASANAAPTCWHLAEGGAGQWNSYLCVDPKGAPTCAVYTEMRAEWGTSRRCLA